MTHLPDCLPATPTQHDCEPVREQYGACPDHDALCAPGCPVAEAGGS